MFSRNDDPHYFSLCHPNCQKHPSWMSLWRRKRIKFPDIAVDEPPWCRGPVYVCVNTFVPPQQCPGQLSLVVGGQSKTSCGLGTKQMCAHGMSGCWIQHVNISTDRGIMVSGSPAVLRGLRISDELDASVCRGWTGSASRMPNLPINNISAKTAWPKLSRKFPLYMKILDSRR